MPPRRRRRDHTDRLNNGLDWHDIEESVANEDDVNALDWYNAGRENFNHYDIMRGPRLHDTVGYLKELTPTLKKKRKKDYRKKVEDNESKRKPIPLGSESIDGRHSRLNTKYSLESEKEVKKNISKTDDLLDTPLEPPSPKKKRKRSASKNPKKKKQKK